MKLEEGNKPAWEEAIPYDQLPKTLQDAVTVVRRFRDRISLD